MFSGRLSPFNFFRNALSWSPGDTRGSEIGTWSQDNNFRDGRIQCLRVGNLLLKLEGTVKKKKNSRFHFIWMVPLTHSVDYK